MKDWIWRIKEVRDRKRARELAIKKALAGTALIGAALICSGFYDGDQQYVEEVYTVQKGDTLWDISCEYMKKNTGGRRYILEYMHGIIEANPCLQNGNEGHLQPGQDLVISYWVKKESE